MKYIDLAIIGDGAASVALLLSLARKTSNELKNNKIVVFSSGQSSALARGLAYQDDLESSLLNRPLAQMSVDPKNSQDVIKWLQSHPGEAGKCIDDGACGIYMPRYLFGQYLFDRMQKAIALLKCRGIEVEIIYKKIVQVTAKNTLISHCKTYYMARRIVYCTGHNSSLDCYHLGAAKNYFNQPYPLKNTVKNIQENAHVAVLGNSLTAIDIALALKQSGHKGKISFLSRNHVLPFVRGEVQTYRLRYLNDERLNVLLEKSNYKLSLRTILRLLRLELSMVGYDWRNIFKTQSNKSFSDKLEDELGAIKNQRLWQSVLVATNAVIEKIWHYLDERSRNLFVTRYQRLWLNSRSPIPAVNARKLLSLLKTGVLNYYSGVVDVKRNEAQNNYTAIFSDHIERQYDVVVNATGPSRAINSSDELMTNLINCGQALRDPWGGIKLDYKTSTLITASQGPHPNQYLLGQNAAGTYFFTNSVELIAKRAAIVADNILASLACRQEKHVA